MIEEGNALGEEVKMILDSYGNYVKESDYLTYDGDKIIINLKSDDSALSWDDLIVLNYIPQDMQGDFHELLFRNNVHWGEVFSQTFPNTEITLSIDAVNNSLMATIGDNKKFGASIINGEIQIVTLFNKPKLDAFHLDSVVRFYQLAV